MGGRRGRVAIADTVFVLELDCEEVCRFWYNKGDETRSGRWGMIGDIGDLMERGDSGVLGD